MEGMVGILGNKFWANKRVLITGHTGFKGSWLSYLLLLQGAAVCGYALEPPTNPALFDIFKLRKYVDSHIGDVCDISHLKQVIEAYNPEVVFHLAAQPLVRESYKEPVNTYLTNVMGTVNLFQCIRTCDSVRAVVNITTDKVYENNEWFWGYRETDRLNGYDPYSNSKACSELVTSSFVNSFFNPEYFSKHQVAVATARAGNVIGGGDWAVDRLVPDCVRALSSGQVIALRNPEAVRPWQYILELLKGYLMLAERLYIDGTEYNGAWNFGPQSTNFSSTEELIKLFCYFWGGNATYEVLLGENLHEASILQLDSAKANTKLGWQVSLSFQKTIFKTAEWYKAFYNGDDVEILTEKEIKEFF
ncbi:MAG: rfbG [Firmicutes bacterium]|nr:rfbG [Bacillota bacterium]